MISLIYGDGSGFTGVMAKDVVSLGGELSARLTHLKFVRMYCVLTCFASVL